MRPAWKRAFSTKNETIFATSFKTRRTPFRRPIQERVEGALARAKIPSLKLKNSRLKSNFLSKQKYSEKVYFLLRLLYYNFNFNLFFCLCYLIKDASLKWGVSWENQERYMCFLERKSKETRKENIKRKEQRNEKERRPFRGSLKETFRRNLSSD